MLLACSGQQAIHQREVKLALHRLNQLPAHRREDRVQPHRRQARPFRFHVIQARRTGVMDLRAQQQIRLAVHDQLRRFAALRQVRRASVLRLNRERMTKQQN